MTAHKIPAPPDWFSPADIKALRYRFCVSQRRFALFLNVSSQTVEAWEQGVRNPDSSAIKLLHIVKYHPGVVGLREKRTTREAGNEVRKNR